jgi:hypothetical protein
VNWVLGTNSCRILLQKRPVRGTRRPEMSSEAAGSLVVDPKRAHRAPAMDLISSSGTKIFPNEKLTFLPKDVSMNYNVAWRNFMSPPLNFSFPLCGSPRRAQCTISLQTASRRRETGVLSRSDAIEFNSRRLPNSQPVRVDQVRYFRPLRYTTIFSSPHSIFLFSTEVADTAANTARTDLCS